MKPHHKPGKLAREAESAAVGYGTAPARILVTAERLFGQHGINNISLRQISLAAGQGNHSAVALHFGGKEGLIAAIIKARRPIIDAGRKDRLEALLAKTSNPSMRELLECQMMPWVDDVDEDGSHPYACFIAQLMWADEEHLLLGMREEAPVFNEIMGRIHACLPHLDADTLSFRLRLILLMFLTTALHKGRLPLSKAGQVSDTAAFSEIINLATAMLMATASEHES